MNDTISRAAAVLANAIDYIITAYKKEQEAQNG